MAVVPPAQVEIAADVTALSSIYSGVVQNGILQLFTPIPSEQIVYGADIRIDVKSRGNLPDRLQLNDLTLVRYRQELVPGYVSYASDIDSALMQVTPYQQLILPLAEGTEVQIVPFHLVSDQQTNNAGTEDNTSFPQQDGTGLIYQNNPFTPQTRDIALMLATLQVNPKNQANIAARASEILGETIDPLTLNPIPNQDNTNFVNLGAGKLNTFDLACVLARIGVGFTLNPITIANRMNQLLGRPGLVQASNILVIPGASIPLAPPPDLGDDLVVVNTDLDTITVLLDGINNFGFNPVFSVGNRPVSVATGDFNGDGFPDVASANQYGNTVSILLGDGRGKVTSTSTISVGSQPSQVVTGDFNGDGNLDLAVANTGSDTVSILLGNGNGGFTAASPVSVGPGPFSIAVGRVNGDNFSDLLVANLLANRVSVLLGFGNGQFSTPVNDQVGIAPTAVVTGRFNGDNFLDWAVANSYSDTVTVILGNGNGGILSKASFPTGNSGDTPTDLATGRLNGDNFTDLVVTNNNTNSVAVLLGNGTGAFSSPVMLPVGGNPYSVEVADLDGDNDDDLAVTICSFDIPDSSQCSGDSVNVLFREGSASFLPAVSFPTGNGPRDLALADFDQSGTADFVVSSGIDNTVEFLFGNGQEDFRPIPGYPVGDQPIAATVGDFNGDSIPDIAVANRGDDTVSVLLGTGGGRFAPATSFGVGDQPSDLVTADFDGDDQLDLAVTNYADNTLTLLRGNGNGGFIAPVNTPVGSNPVSILTADFDSDGFSDLFVINAGSQGGTFIYGEGDGLLQLPEITGGVTPVAADAGDFNGDGRQDLVVANYIPNNVSVFLGNADRTIRTATNFEVGSNPVSVITGRFNADRFEDVAVVNFTGDSVTVRVANSLGSLGLPDTLNLPPGSYPSDIDVGYFNQDELADLAVANAESDTVSILLGNGNGGFGSVSSFPVGAFPRSLTAADLN
ncbi:MAG: VCBS repeat-containing protein [Synechococcaceae cyanobacterium SM2_3_1]|nr:VCBS repeat-containing protein [Synechococcaceae cyanobacterium SM2_3_1]